VLYFVLVVQRNGLRENTIEDFFQSWEQYSAAVISFSESHRTNKELKRCFRDITDDSEADSEFLHCLDIFASYFFHRVSNCITLSKLLFD